MKAKSYIQNATHLSHQVDPKLDNPVELYTFEDHRLFHRILYFFFGVPGAHGLALSNKICPPPTGETRVRHRISTRRLNANLQPRLNCLKLPQTAPPCSGYPHIIWGVLIREM